MSTPFMVRPPEEETRRPIKPNEEPPKPPLVVIKLLIQQTWESVLAPLTGKVKKQVEIRTAPLEERMRDARNKALSDEEVEVLLNDPNPMVRLELVHNDTISGEVLERLKHDPDVTVSTIARRKQIQFIL